MDVLSYLKSKEAKEYAKKVENDLSKTDEKIGNLSELQTNEKSNLVDSVNEVSSQLAQNEQDIKEMPPQVASSNLNAIWEPPQQPRLDDIAPRVPVHQDTMISLYDNLLDNHPDYITKEIMGKDY